MTFFHFVLHIIKYMQHSTKAISKKHRTFASELRETDLGVYIRFVLVESLVVCFDTV